MPISYLNCLFKDTLNLNCKICAFGYGNFKGICYKLDNKCSTYQTNECSSCKTGTLSNGYCEWFNRQKWFFYLSYYLFNISFYFI
jgi:hypothetical protein